MGYFQLYFKNNVNKKFYVDQILITVKFLGYFYALILITENEL